MPKLPFRTWRGSQGDVRTSELRCWGDCASPKSRLASGPAPTAPHFTAPELSLVENRSGSAVSCTLESTGDVSFEIVISAGRPPWVQTVRFAEAAT